MQITQTFRNKTLLTLIAIVWITLAVIHTLFLVFMAKMPIEYSITESAVFNTLFIILTLGILTSHQFESGENPLTKSILTFYLPLVVIIDTIWLMVGAAIVQSLVKDTSQTEFLFESLKYRALIGFFLYSLVVMIIQTVKYYQNYQEKMLKASRLESQLQRSKVDTLQMQMQPHFLFNALNSISSLTFEDCDKTREMIIRLSDFLRYTTKYSEKQLVKFSDELDHIDQYLAIEHLRFGDRLKYEKEISSIAAQRFLPCLVLQPIIENAIKHGVNQSLDPVLIRLSASIRNNYLEIKVSNSKDGESNKKGTGTGLKNLTNRLSILYGDRANIKVLNETSKFTVSITIP